MKSVAPAMMTLLTEPPLPPFGFARLVVPPSPALMVNPSESARIITFEIEPPAAPSPPIPASIRFVTESTSTFCTRLPTFPGAGTNAKTPLPPGVSTTAAPAPMYLGKKSNVSPLPAEPARMEPTLPLTMTLLILPLASTFPPTSSGTPATEIDPPTELPTVNPFTFTPGIIGPVMTNVSSARLGVPCSLRL